MSGQFRRILYGGDYNPNQWDRSIWKEDMRIFRDARINSATINVFSWSKLQPSEDVYDFSELDDIVQMLSEEGYDIVLATSTGAMPAWMYKNYPEVARVDYQGRRHRFGQRHNACPNSKAFRHFASALVEQLAKRYGSNPHVTCWHISNEYGGECYCENCENAFRRWLRRKYGTTEAVNKAWNLSFWGHNVYEWDEIVLPNVLGDGMEDGLHTSFAGLSIDYRRFMSDSILGNYTMERDIIRKYAPDSVITTNLMGTFKGLDYFKWAKEMDIVSWDNYPSYNTPWSFVAMSHDLMRGLKDQPFMLMEQTPSQQNWQPYNSLKRPGQMRAQSYQTIAHGADTIQFFQLRRSVGGCEKFHGAVIAHVGTENTRVFGEVSRLGHELEMLSSVLPGSRSSADVGIVFDWDNYWGLEYTSGPTKDLAYVDQIHRYYRYFYERNIAVSMIPVDADFSKYKVVVAPVLYMVRPDVKKALEQYVAGGGTLVTTYMSGLVDETDNVYLGGYPGPLRSMAGVWVEEIDALAPEQNNEVVFQDGRRFACRIVCDLIHTEGAAALGTYGSDFYEGTPAVTRNTYGSGHTYYIGTVMDADGIAAVLDMAVSEAGAEPVIREDTMLEITRRTSGDGKDYYFLINFSDSIQSVPASLAGKKELLEDRILDGSEKLKKFDVMIVEA